MIKKVYIFNEIFYNYFYVRWKVNHIVSFYDRNFQYQFILIEYYEIN